MLYTAAALIVFTLIFTGIGLLATLRWRSTQELRFSTLLLRFWTGWALTVAALQIWHLFFKVSTAAFWLAALCGLGGWVAARGPVRAYLRGLRPLSALALAALALIPAVALGAHIFFVPPHYDHGLYHQQTIMWFNQYAVVPGLGNLHHRLAFNNANFLYAALINAAPPAGRAFFTANTTLAFVVILQCAAGVYRLFERGKTAAGLPLTAVYYALMLPAVLWHYSTTHLPGYSPDVVVFSLQTVLGGELLRLFTAQVEDRRDALLSIILLAAVGVTVKLSFGVFGALAALAALVFYLRHPPTADAPRRSVLAGLGLPVALGALLVIPWLARGVLLSGYPLFPSTALSIPVPWRMPYPLVEPISPIILNWARSANQTIQYTGDLAWLRQWYAAFPFDVVKRVFMLACAAAGLGLVWLAAEVLRARRLREAPALGASLWGTAVLLIVSGLSVLGWFFLAPDYRFSGALIWMLAAEALVLLHSLAIRSRVTRDPLRLAVGLLLGLTILVSPNHFEIHKPGQQTILPVSESEWVRQFIPDAPAEARVTDSGLEVRVPAPPSDQCYDLPLPCTRAEDYLPSLRLIEPGDMQRGFTLQP